MADLEMFGQYYRLANQLIEKVSKEEIAECARLLIEMPHLHPQSQSFISDAL